MILANYATPLTKWHLNSALKILQYILSVTMTLFIRRRWLRRYNCPGVAVDLWEWEYHCENNETSLWISTSPEMWNIHSRHLQVFLLSQLWATHWDPLSLARHFSISSEYQWDAKDIETFLFSGVFRSWQANVSPARALICSLPSGLTRRTSKPVTFLSNHRANSRASVHWELLVASNSWHQRKHWTHYSQHIPWNVRVHKLFSLFTRFDFKYVFAEKMV